MRARFAARLPVLLPFAFGLWLTGTSLSGGIGSFGVYDGKRVLELALLFVVFALTIISPSQRHATASLVSALPSWAKLAFAAFLTLGLLSGSRLPHPGYAYVEVAMLFLLVVTSVCVAAAYRCTPLLFERLVLAAIALLVLGIVTQELLAVFIYLANDQQYNYRESLIYFLHPRMFNHLQTWTLPLLPLLPLVFARSRGWLILCITLIGFQWFVILVTGARGSTVSLISAMTLMAFLFKQSRGAWLRPQLAGLATGVLMYAAVYLLIAQSVPEGNAYIDESVGRPLMHTSGRLDLWTFALEGARTHPLLGTGPMHYACHVGRYIAASPHNFPLQILSEWGIPAFVLLATLFLWLARGWVRWLRNRSERSNDDALRAACISTACVAAVIHLGASGLMIAPASQVAGMLVAGWLIALSTTRWSDAAPERKWTGHLLLVLGLLCSMALLGFAWKEQGDITTRTTYAAEYGPITPRFWQDGKTCLYRWD